MTVGYSVGKGDLDAALGDIATSTRDMLTRGNNLVNCLTGLTDAQLGNLGYSPSDVALIRAVQSDMSTLLQVFPGTVALPVAHNFLANLSQLYGAR